jgi:hypothetical protein
MKSLHLPNPNKLFSPEEFNSLVSSIDHRIKSLNSLEDVCYGHLDCLFEKVVEGKYKDSAKDPFSDKELTVSDVVTDLKINLANIKKNLFYLEKAKVKLLLIKEYDN